MRLLRFLLLVVVLVGLGISGPGQAHAAGTITVMTTVTNADGRLESFGIDPGGAVWHDYETLPGGGGWSGWQQLGSALPSGVTGFSELTSAYNMGSGDAELFAVGSDGKDYHAWQSAPNSAFGSWTSFGAGSYRALAAGMNADGRVEVFGLDGSGNVFHNYQNSPAGSWNGWSSLGVSQPEPMASLAAQYNAGSGDLELFGVGTSTGSDYHVWQSAPNSGWGSWTALNGGKYHGLSAVSNADGRTEVFGLDASGNVYHDYQTTVGGGWSGWSAWNVQSTAPPSMSALAVGYSPPVGAFVIVATDRAGNIDLEYQNGPNGSLSASQWFAPWNGTAFPGGGPFTVTKAGTGDKMSGQYLPPTAVMSATGGMYKLTQQGDGNLVLYDYNNTAHWSTKTSGAKSPVTTALQPHGDLITYAGPRLLWHAGTDGHRGDCLWLQNDGNLVLYPSCASATNGFWATATYTTGNDSSQLKSGQSIGNGQRVSSSGGIYHVQFTSGGGILVCSVDVCGDASNPGTGTWSQIAPNGGGTFLVMQFDGNLVLYANDTALWSSGTSNNGGAYAYMQNDGNFVVYSSGNSGLWASHTTYPPSGTVSAGGQTGTRIAEGQTLQPGQSITSPNGAYRLTAQGDGNIVEYQGSSALWATGTVGAGNIFLTMQSDGNLVGYTGDTGHWSDCTDGHTGAFASLQNDGNFVVYSSSGTALWARTWAGACGNPPPGWDPGSNDYPWQPLCTYGDCGSGSVACNSGNGYCGDPWGMAYGQCVSFVAWKLYERYGGTQRPSPATGTQNQNWRPSNPGVNGDPINGNWGSAVSWASSAAGAGFSVSQTPAVGDVAQWGYDKGMGSAGHVMMVVAVSQGNYITVAGYNTHLDGSYAEWNIPWGDNSWSSGNGYGYAPPWPDNFLAIGP